MSQSYDNGLANDQHRSYDSEGLDPNLRRIMERAEALVSLPADDPRRGGEALQRLEELTAHALQRDLSKYSEEQAKLIESTAKLGRSLIRIIGQMRGKAQRQECLTLLVDAYKLHARLMEATDEDHLGKWRREILELAGLVRDFRLQSHLMIAEPIWTRSHVPRDWSALWFVGSDEVRKACAKACDSWGLQLREPTAGDYAQSCWDRLRECSIAVFDLSVEGSEFADTCYQMGIAFTLGRSVVVTAPRGVTIPFDVGVEPVALDEESDVVKLITTALEAALFDVGFASEENSSSETFSQAVLRSRSWYERDHLLRFVERLKQDNIQPSDPLQVRWALTTLWGGSHNRPIFITPIWPGTYPAEIKRCFHIMPFSKPWSDRVQENVEDACRTAAIEYDRGDVAEGDPRIRQEIWKKIGSATHIIADITGHNPNVAFELGMVHTLGGKAELILRQRDEIDSPPRMLHHIRYEEYDLESDHSLKTKVVEFFGNNSNR